MLTHCSSQDCVCEFPYYLDLPQAWVDYDYIEPKLISDMVLRISPTWFTCLLRLFSESWIMINRDDDDAFFTTRFCLWLPFHLDLPQAWVDYDAIGPKLISDMVLKTSPTTTIATTVLRAIASFIIDWTLTYKERAFKLRRMQPEGWKTLFYCSYCNR